MNLRKSSPSAFLSAVSRPFAQGIHGQEDLDPQKRRPYKAAKQTGCGDGESIGYGGEGIGKRRRRGTFKNGGNPTLNVLDVPAAHADLHFMRGRVK